MEKIRNLSLKKTILLYLVISLTAAFLLSGFTVHFARNMQNKIWEKYIELCRLHGRVSAIWKEIRD